MRELHANVIINSSLIIIKQNHLLFLLELSCHFDYVSYFDFFSMLEKKLSYYPSEIQILQRIYYNIASALHVSACVHQNI